METFQLHQKNIFLAEIYISTLYGGDPRSLSKRGYKTRTVTTFGVEIGKKIVGRMDIFSLTNVLDEVGLLIEVSGPLNLPDITERSIRLADIELPEWAMFSYIANVHIEEDFRGKGLGTALYKNAITNLSTNGPVYGITNNQKMIDVVWANNGGVLDIPGSIYKVDTSMEEYFSLSNEPLIDRRFYITRGPYTESYVYLGWSGKKLMYVVINELGYQYYGAESMVEAGYHKMGNGYSGRMPGQSICILSPDIVEDEIVPVLRDLFSNTDILRSKWRTILHIDPFAPVLSKEKTYLPLQEFLIRKVGQEMVIEQAQGKTFVFAHPCS